MDYLIPKRKKVSGTPLDEAIEGAVASSVDTDDTIFKDTLIVNRLTVKERLKIPIGTDMYD